jgi:hypothetical protein
LDCDGDWGYAYGKRAADGCPEGTWWGCHRNTGEALGAVGAPFGGASYCAESTPKCRSLQGSRWAPML